ncbi:helix-turn-helix transcriptional regulator [Arthrobacter tecti]
MSQKGATAAEDRLLTFDEVADYLSVSKSTLYSWRSREKGPKGISVGRFVRYRRSDVDAWLQSESRASSE